jgi:DNA-binding PadR family transcriptional regulator
MESARDVERAGQAPLTPAVFHILLALAEGERHGYAIMREVAQQSGGRMRLGPGTLYGSLRRLLEEGLIEETEARPDPALDDERRRYYRLTPEGRRVAEAEAARLDALARTARERGLLPGFAGGEPAGMGGAR